MNCPHCSRTLGVNNASGVCTKCKDNLRCNICRKPQPSRRTCEDCKEVMAFLTLVHKDDQAEPMPGIRVFSTRYAK